jgi:hypothetical protein
LARRASVGLAIAFFLMAAGGAQVLAATPASPARTATPQVSGLTATAHHDIATRLEGLAGLSREIADSRSLDSADRALLLQEVKSAREGLQKLDARLDKDTEPQALKADVEAIAGFRVYSLIVPQAHGLMAADRVLFYCTTRFPAIERHIQDTIDKRSALGRPSPAAASALADFKTHSGQACRLAKSAQDGLRPLGSAPSPRAEAGLRVALAQLKETRAALAAAAADVRAVIQALQA